MLITTQNEIISLMPTSRWDKLELLFGCLEQEEAVALEPLLGNSLYQHLLTEYDRLREEYTDITATTVRPTGKAKQDAQLAHADVTERLDQIQQGRYRETYTGAAEGEQNVSAEDLQIIRLIRICQQVEFYKMLAHNAWLFSISFNEGGGMNRVSADGYDEADSKHIEGAAKDAWMKAGRSIDQLLLFLEADAKGGRLFTEMWKEADAFYLQKDLLFQTAQVLNKFLDIKGERMAYTALVRDIRFCQDTYLEPRIGTTLLEAVVDYANNGGDNAVMKTLLKKLRIALAFYVESRRTTLLTGAGTYATAGSQKEAKLARRDSMTDAQQALATACQFIEENIDALGDAAVGTPIYNAIRAREAREAADKANACAARERQRKAVCEQNNRKLFTGFPATHRMPEHHS